MAKLMCSGSLLISVLESLERANIDYCIAHGYETFPTDIPSDVDVIVKSEDLSRLPKILAPFGITQWIQHESTAHFIVLTGEIKPLQIPFLQFDASSDFRRDGFVLLKEDDFLEKRKRYKNIFWVSSSDVEYIYYLTKKIGKTKINSEHVKRLQILYVEDPNGCSNWLRKFFPENMVPLIQDASKTGNWSSINLAELKGKMLKHNFNLKPDNFIKYRIKDIFRQLHRIFSPTGIWVVFLGPDGSGKSSVLKQVQYDLLQSFRQTKTYHFRPSILWKSKIASDEVVSHPHSQGYKGPIRSVIKVFACYFDWLVGYWLEILPRLIKSTLVLVDRNFVDLAVDPLRHQISCSKWLINFLIPLLPRPDLTIYLNVNPEVAFARKQEITKLNLTKLKKAYLDAYAANPNGAFIIDANQDLDAVVMDVEKIIINYLQNRSNKRLGLI